MVLLRVTALTSLLERWNWGVVAILDLPLSHHRFIPLWLDTPLQKFLHTSLRGPALTKAGPELLHNVNICVVIAVKNRTWSGVPVNLQHRTSGNVWMSKRNYRKHCINRSSEELKCLLENVRRTRLSAIKNWVSRSEYKVISYFQQTCYVSKT